MFETDASKLNRIMQCNGSVKMEPFAPPKIDDASESRREGIAAHYVALQVFNGVFSDPLKMVDRRAPNGVYVTAEMAEVASTKAARVDDRGFISIPFRRCT